jgi:hypothetical protein
LGTRGAWPVTNPPGKLKFAEQQPLKHVIAMAN